MSQGVVEHRKQVARLLLALLVDSLFWQALQDYLEELTDRSDVCQCSETLKFLNADEHNTAIKHAIQEDMRRALSTNSQTEETLAKLEARERENSILQSEIDCLQREAEAVQARCESCETESNSLRPIIVKQVAPSCGLVLRCRRALNLAQADSLIAKSQEIEELGKKKRACIDQVLLPALCTALALTRRTRSRVCSSRTSCRSRR
jgi:hypothetical protein